VVIGEEEEEPHDGQHLLVVCGVSTSLRGWKLRLAGFGCDGDGGETVLTDYTCIC
jgi:hypothetical protein